jgi:hypothetical protein
MSRSKSLLVSLGLVTIVTTGVAAQTDRSHLGARVSYNFDAEAVGLGAQLSFPVRNHLEFYPSFDYFFVDVGTLWALNADLKYRLRSVAALRWLYLGSGLNLSRFSHQSVGGSELGLNLFGGVESLRGRIHPFAEARLTIGGDAAFLLAAGLNFTLGGH